MNNNLLGGYITKDKLFFYRNYEAYRYHTQTTTNRTVLTALHYRF